MEDLKRLCIHTATTKPWSVEIALANYARAGVAGITLWRDALEGRDPAAVGRLARDSGLQVISLCRGGFFPSPDGDARRRAIEDNLAAIGEAEALGAPLIVLVPGSDPGQSLEDSRDQIAEGISAVAGRARDAGVQLAIEPLHPMYADAKSAVNTMKSANDMCRDLNLDNVGVAVDVYHIWWDPEAFAEIERCGASGRLLAFHVCDWRSPTEHFLLDRGLPGEGCIEVPRFRKAVEKAGFQGFIEVEVFSTRHWSSDQTRYLEKIIRAYREFV
ncbi:MAG: sugar phosphate isomerase/epimerase [Spirochaetaceae bacterium]|nr:MAG: sugar phosphate isomerase/epimerase [Spirochaetaceae bacterium]